MSIQNIDWSNLGFTVRKTNGIMVSHFLDGKWSTPVLEKTDMLSISSYAGILNYSNGCFEGLKAFRGADGKVRLFRPDENARRLLRSAEFLDMPRPTEQMFIDMCLAYVKANIDYLPPYGYNASMYLRPILVGSNPQMNLNSSTEAIFAVMGIPVGSYSGAKSLTTASAVISRDFDRAAPNGTGSYKLCCNYAPSFHSYNIAHATGFQELLFLDPATKTNIDEFGSSNFFGIKDGVYVTPLSPSVLPSITNKSLQAVASDMGLKIEKRIVPFSEIDSFEEVNACGTAVVITPIGTLTDKPGLRSEEVTRVYKFGDPSVCGKTSAALYHSLRAIQNGEEKDLHDWCLVL